MHTESLEKAGTYAAGLNRLRAGVRAQKIAARGKDIDRAEGFIQSLPVKKIRIRERPERRFNTAFVHRHQPAGIRIRKRLQQSRVDRAKDSDAGADPESQNENRRHRKTGILAQLPQSKTEVLQNPLKPEADGLVALVSQPRVISELTIRSMPCIFSRHALRSKLLLRLRAMKGHLLFKFMAEFFATDKYPQLPEKTPQRFHPRPPMRPAARGQSRQSSLQTVKAPHPVACGRPESACSNAPVGWSPSFSTPL